MLRSFTKLIAAIGVLVCVSVTQATIMEMEVNDMLGTATPIMRTGLDFADVGIAELGGGGGDVDVFSIDLFAGDIFMANTAGLGGLTIGSDPDTILGLIDPTGTIIEFNDDGFGFGSNYSAVIPTDGTHYVAVSGFGDGSVFDIGSAFGAAAFTGAHGEAGPYVLTVSVLGVPEPAGLAMIGFAGLLLGFLRRR